VKLGCSKMQCHAIYSRWILLVALLPWGAKSRHQTGDFYNGHRAEEDGGGPNGWWHYLSKFTLDKEGGHVAVRLRVEEAPDNDDEMLRLNHELNGTEKMDFMMYLDSTWDKVPDMISRKHCMGDPSIPEPEFVATIDFPNNHAFWGEWNTQDIDTQNRPHTWHFVLSDCEKSLLGYTIGFELEVQQFDNSEFSVERKNSIAAHSIASLLNLLVSIWWYYRIVGLKLRTNFEIHPFLWIISMMFGLQLIGHLCHLWHLTDYREDGIGNEIIDGFGEGFLMANNVLQASLLLVVALGYELSNSDFRNDAMAIWCTVIPILAIHVGLVIISRFSARDKAHTYHGHEGMIGWCLLTIRFMFFVWFISASSYTKELVATQKKLANFLTRFQIIGSVIFLTYPITFCVLPFIAAYWRHRIMQAVVLTMQFIANFWLAKLFTDSGFFTLKWDIIPTGPNDYRIDPEEWEAIHKDAPQDENDAYHIARRARQLKETQSLIEAMPIGLPMSNRAHEA